MISDFNAGLDSNTYGITHVVCNCVRYYMMGALKYFYIAIYSCPFSRTFL